MRTMVLLAHNLKALRRKQNISQQVLADKLYISRASLAKYEGGINEPSLGLTVKLSRYFNISVDTFLTVDLERMEIAALLNDNNTSGMIMPIQVDKHGENVIEVVPHSAQAGYMGQYSDPGFIESLDQMALPFQELHGKCRAFPIEGDSMPPYGTGCYVVGRYISSSSEIQKGKRYILLSRDEGIVFKRLYRDQKNDAMIHLHSDNPAYKPFNMHLQEVQEIWEFVAAISFRDAGDNSFASDVMTRVKELQDEVQKLATQLVPAGR